MAEEKKKCVINKHYVFEKAHKELGLLTDFELELYFKGYTQGMKDIVEPLGFEVVINE